MEYTIEKYEGTHVVSIHGSMLHILDHQKLLHTLTDLIDDGFSKFVIDLGDLKHINSSGLGVLVTILTKSRKAHGDTALAAIPDHMDQLLVITKLNSIFRTEPTVQEALHHFQGALKVNRA